MPSRVGIQYLPSLQPSRGFGSPRMLFKGGDQPGVHPGWIDQRIEEYIRVTTPQNHGFVIHDGFLFRIFPYAAHKGLIRSMSFLIA